MQASSTRWPPPCYFTEHVFIAKTSASVRSWGVSLIRSSRAHFLGFVEATDAQAAEAAAVLAFNLDAWQRKRLIVRERLR